MLLQVYRGFQAALLAVSFVVMLAGEEIPKSLTPDTLRPSEVRLPWVISGPEMDNQTLNIVDVGALLPSETVKINIAVENQSTETTRLKLISPGCKCLRSELGQWDGTLKAGEKHSFLIAYDAGAQESTIDNTFQVECTFNSGISRVINIPIKGLVRGILAVGDAAESLDLTTIQFQFTDKCILASRPISLVSNNDKHALSGVNPTSIFGNCHFKALKKDSGFELSALFEEPSNGALTIGNVRSIARFSYEFTNNIPGFFDEKAVDCLFVTPGIRVTPSVRFWGAIDLSKELRDSVTIFGIPNIKEAVNAKVEIYAAGVCTKMSLQNVLVKDGQTVVFSFSVGALNAILSKPLTNVVIERKVNLVPFVANLSVEVITQGNTYSVNVVRTGLVQKTALQDIKGP